MVDQRAITARLNLDAQVMLYDLLDRHTNGIGARIGTAVVMAERWRQRKCARRRPVLPKSAARTRGG